MRNQKTTDVSYPYATFKTRLELEGSYDRLDEETQGRLQDAIIASHLQLSTWLRTVRGNQAEMVHSGDEFVGYAGNDQDRITVRVTITDTKDALPRPIAQLLANNIARSVQNHADSAISGAPASNDLLVEIQEQQSLEIQAAYGAQRFEGFQSSSHQRELVGAGGDRSGDRSSRTQR
jgi:hypothetical protein